MDRLEYIKQQVIELFKMAKEEREDILAYLLELAAAEANDKINKRRGQKQP